MYLRKIEVLSTGPIRHEQPLRDIAMNAGPSPILRPANEAVFDRIPMNVIDVTAPIVLVANGVFVKPPLPDVGLATTPAARKSAGCIAV
jgi:hypothetical protein